MAWTWDMVPVMGSNDLSTKMGHSDTSSAERYDVFHPLFLMMRHALGIGLTRFDMV